MISSQRICVRLVSGSIVYDGPRHNSLEELRREVATTMGLENKNEIVFCSGDAVLRTIEEAEEQITAVRDQVMRLLDEFVLHLHGELPKHLWPARTHRGLMLAAVENDGWALQHASDDLQDDRDIVLAAVTNFGHSLSWASPRLRDDRDVVLAAVAQCGIALMYASSNLRDDRDVVLAAVKQNHFALGYASLELRSDKEILRILNSLWGISSIDCPDPWQCT
jgi:hypothetical protein